MYLLCSEKRNTFRQSSRKPAASDLYWAAVPMEQVDSDGSITQISVSPVNSWGHYRVGGAKHAAG